MANSASDNLRILVVDDDTMVLRMLAEVLDRPGWSVETFESSCDAMKTLEGGGFDVALVDVVMPPPTGMDILRRLNTLPEAPAVVMLTACASLDMAIEAMREGAADFIAKPFDDGDELTGAIERAARRRSRRLEESAGSEGGLQRMASIVHELRGPAEGIIGYADVARHYIRSGRPEKGLGNLDRIVETVRQLDEMISQLLNFSRGEAGQLAVHPQSLSPSEIVRNVARLYEGRLLTRRMTLDIDVPADLPRIAADPDHLRRVLLNLLSNSYKYAPAESTVRIVGRRNARASAVTLTVSDAGPGIPSWARKVVFEPFRRLQQHEGLPGAGLGLAIVKRLVEINGGQICIAGRADRGARICLTLPVDQPQAAAMGG